MDNASIPKTAFNNMDLGDLSFVSFTTLDEDLEFQACRTPGPQVTDQLYQQLLATQAKLHIHHRFQRVLAGQIRDAEVVKNRLGLSSFNVANHPLVVKLSSLTTTQHLLRRYQLVLLRDMMRMKQALGINVRPRRWESWCRHEAHLQREAPNVHDLFLWTQEPHGNDEDPDRLSHTRVTPWRTCQ